MGLGLTKFMPTEIVHTDVLSAGHSTAAGSGGGKLLDLARARFKLNENAATDRDYIESCFGRSLYPPRDPGGHRTAAVHRHPWRVPSVVHRRGA